MQLPEYVTVQEVQRVCKELGLSDWSKKTEPKVIPEEAQIILSEVNTVGMDIPLEDFSVGLEVELEHGTQFKDANVTNNHPILTGKIVLAHLKESARPAPPLRGIWARSWAGFPRGRADAPTGSRSASS